MSEENTGNHGEAAILAAIVRVDGRVVAIGESLAAIDRRLTKVETAGEAGAGKCVAHDSDLRALRADVHRLELETARSAGRSGADAAGISTKVAGIGAVILAALSALISHLIGRAVGP